MSNQRRIEMDSFRQDISTRLAPLTHRQQLLFGIIISERLFPAFTEFSRKNKWGKIEVLRTALDMLYQIAIKDDLYDDQEIQDMIERVEMQTPDTEDFSDTLTSLALNSCSSIYSTLTYLIDKDPSNIVDVAISARDTVDTFIQEKEKLEPNHPHLEEHIDSNPLMLEEKNFQIQLIKKLTMVTTDITNELMTGLTGKKLILDYTLI